MICDFSSGHLDITVALELAEYLVDETEYVPWRIGLEALSYINALLEGHPDYFYFKVSTTNTGRHKGKLKATTDTNDI